MENSKTSEILEQGLKKFLVLGLIFVLFFIIGISLYNLHKLLINFI